MKIDNLKEILRDEGFRPKVDKDGDLIFKYEGKTYLLDIDKDDEYFVRIILPNFWELESDSEHDLANKIARDVTKRIKVAKVFAVKNNMWSTAELFLPNEDSIRPIINRILSVVSGAAVLFAREMKGQHESDSEA